MGKNWAYKPLLFFIFVDYSDRHFLPQTFPDKPSISNGFVSSKLIFKANILESKQTNK